jgi:hypothetical protein
LQRFSDNWMNSLKRNKTNKSGNVHEGTTVFDKATKVMQRQVVPVLADTWYLQMCDTNSLETYYNIVNTVMDLL